MDSRTFASPGLQAAFGSLPEESLPLNIRAVAAMRPIAPRKISQIAPSSILAAVAVPEPIRVTHSEPPHIPAFPYHELTYSTLKDLLNNINSMHEDVAEIARWVQTHHDRIVYDFVYDVERCSTLPTPLLIEYVSRIKRTLAQDAHERTTLRSGAQHLGFFTEEQIASLNETKGRFIAELRSGRHVLREGGAWLDDESESESESESEHPF